MGRLFWKFFIFIWLLQMAGMITVGTTFWLRHKAFEAERAQEMAATGKVWKRDPRHPRNPYRKTIPVEPLIATLLASLLCAGLLARYFSKPIRHLKTAFDAAADGNLDVRIGNSMGQRKDELADLGHDFDRMADRLKQSMQSQRRLLHDVSHELRSPLARLQAAVGLARQTPDKLTASMDRIELESSRIDQLVGELLTLSRLDAGAYDLNGEPFMIMDLLDEILDDARFEAETSGHRVEFAGDSSASIRGHAEWLHSAIENVVRNALRHTPAGKTIRLACEDDLSGNILISVCDEGAGVPATELPHLFEPFFRGAQANGTSGHGLGLAIAKRIVEANGGSIRASNREAGGLCVDIILPAWRTPHR